LVPKLFEESEFYKGLFGWKLWLVRSDVLDRLTWMIWADFGSSLALTTGCYTTGTILSFLVGSRLPLPRGIWPPDLFEI